MAENPQNNNKQKENPYLVDDLSFMEPNALNALDFDGKKAMYMRVLQIVQVDNAKDGDSGNRNEDIFPELKTQNILIRSAHAALSKATDPSVFSLPMINKIYEDAVRTIQDRLSREKLRKLTMDAGKNSHITYDLSFLIDAVREAKNDYNMLVSRQGKVRAEKADTSKDKWEKADGGLGRRIN